MACATPRSPSGCPVRRGSPGLHNLLVHSKLGKPPQRWFSTSPAPDRGEGLAFWIDRGWRVGRRLLPRLGPAPEWVPAERAEEVARWLASAPQPAVLKCFASSALRVASAAVAAGLDLSRSVVFAGGEPLTLARREFLARSGLRAFARYAATETGFIAGACPHGEDGGEMHLYSDRLAVIGPEPEGPAAPFAFTVLSLAAPKVLLNVELGDHGRLRRRSCGCALGRAGLAWHLRDVHSPAKIAAEGVKLGEIDFARLVEEAARDLGGAPDDLQIWLGLDSGAGGASRITLVLAPGSPIDPDALQSRLRELLPQLPGGALASRLWFEGGALTIERRPLRLGPGQKMRRIVREGRRRCVLIPRSGLESTTAPRRAISPSAAASRSAWNGAVRACSRDRSGRISARAPAISPTPSPGAAPGWWASISIRPWRSTRIAAGRNPSPSRRRDPSRCGTAPARASSRSPCSAACRVRGTWRGSSPRRPACSPPAARSASAR